jgi:hypothetical protein
VKDHVHVLGHDYCNVQVNLAPMVMSGTMEDDVARYRRHLPAPVRAEAHEMGLAVILDVRQIAAIKVAGWTRHAILDS